MGFFWSHHRHSLKKVTFNIDNIYEVATQWLIKLNLFFLPDVIFKIMLMISSSLPSNPASPQKVIF